MVHLLLALKDTTPPPSIYRFEMQGFNVLLGSHYDHYYLQYNQFDVNPIDAHIFEIESSK